MLLLGSWGFPHELSSYIYFPHHCIFCIHCCSGRIALVYSSSEKDTAYLVTPCFLLPAGRETTSPHCGGLPGPPCPWRRAVAATEVLYLWHFSHGILGPDTVNKLRRGRRWGAGEMWCLASERILPSKQNCAILDPVFLNRKMLYQQSFISS